MANAVVIRTLVDGPILTRLELTAVLDTADLVDFEVADIANFEQVDPLSRKKGTGFGIVSIPSYSISDGLEVQIYFEADTPDLFSVLTGRGSLSYAKEGFRRCMNSGRTGRILISTLGVIDGGTATFTIKLELRKQTS